MDSFGTGLESCLDDVVDFKVALAGGGGADEDSLVCVLGEKGVLVRFGVDGHSGYAQLPAGTHHPDGYLSPVGDQDLIEHPQC